MKHLKLFEAYNFSQINTLYRWCGQAGLFMYFYGDIPSETMAKYLFQQYKMPNEFPKLHLVMQGSHTDGNGESIINGLETEQQLCFTVDPNYIGEPYTGDAFIRLNLDFKKMYNELDQSKFVNLISNGEAEIRYTGDIVDWTKYLIKIDILDELYFDGLEDDFGEWKAIIQWMPEHFKKFVKVFSNEKQLLIRDNKFDKNKLRNVI